MGSHSKGLQSKGKLLNPDFPFVRGLRILSTFLLLYVAIVVQIQVRKSPACGPESANMHTSTQAHKPTST
jgi:hypothetical protein